MFREIFRFELRQQLRSPLLWMVAVLFGALAFAATASSSVTIGGSIGNVHRNAPWVVINTLAIFSVIGLFLIPIFVAGAVLRDFSANTADMMFATPVSRGSYLGGRFAAGWLISVLVLLAVAIGSWLGSLMPWVAAARLGPTPWAAYAWALGVLVLPNLFLLSALLMLLAAFTRSMLATYVGVISFFVLRIIAGLALGAQNLAHQKLAALFDPFGIGALHLATRYWTASDRNLRIPPLTGLLAENRLLWSGIALALLALSLVVFKPDREGIRWFRRRSKPAPAAADTSARAPLTPAPVSVRSGLPARLAQLHTLVRLDTLAVLRSTAFLVILLFGLINLTATLSFSGQIFGTHIYPVTELMAQGINGSYKWLLWIVIGFYAGELVWRERSIRIHEVMDALPTADWQPMVSKLIALIVVIVVFLLAGSLYCMGFQLVHGLHDLQPLLYLKFLGLNLLEFSWFALLAIGLQILASNKFAGYALIVGYMVGMIALAQLHLTDNLYLPGSAPAAPYSDINGFGTFWIGTLWFRAYWYCFGLSLLVLAALFRARGNPGRWRERFSVAAQRFRAPSRVALALALAGFVGIGAFVYYNTHVLYRYQTYDGRQRLAADYEKDFKQYQNIAQPRITDVNLNIAMYPHQRRVDVRGRYTLVNRHAHPIDRLLVQLPVLQTREFKVALHFPAHSTEIANARQGFYLYRLAKPPAHGASRPLDFA